MRCNFHNFSPIWSDALYSVQLLRRECGIMVDSDYVSMIKNAYLDEIYNFAHRDVVWTEHLPLYFSARRITHLRVEIELPPIFPSRNGGEDGRFNSRLC